MGGSNSGSDQPHRKQVDPQEDLRRISAAQEARDCAHHCAKAVGPRVRDEEVGRTHGVIGDVCAERVAATGARRARKDDVLDHLRREKAQTVWSEHSGAPQQIWVANAQCA